MTVRSSLFLASSLVVAIGATVLLTTFNTSPVTSDGYEETGARAQWELLRLRDPATGKIPAHIHQLEQEFAATLPQKGASGKGEAALSSDWTPRGPWNVGGRTRALAMDITNEKIILAGGVSGGIWRSTDGGAHWSATFTPAQMKSVSCLRQDTRPGKEQIWYCGTGEFWGNSSQLNGDGILKSIDGGQSWQPLKATVTNTPQAWDNIYEFVWNIVTNPANQTQDELFAAPALGGIVRSTDGGATWKSVLGNFGNQYSYFGDVAITSKGVLYAALSKTAPGGASSLVKGMFRSTDGGTTWKDITPKDFPDTCNRITIGISPSDENQVYFLANTPGSGFKGLGFEGREDWNSLWKYTYIALDGTGVGGKWENRSQFLPNFGGEFGDFSSQGSYDLLVRVKPDDPNVVFLGGTNLYRSTDGFASRNNSTWIGGYKPNTTRPDYELYPNQHPDQHELVFSRSNPKVMLSGNDGGVWQCNDNTAPLPVWNSLNNGYLTTQFYTVALDQNTPKSTIIIGGLQDNGTFFVNSTSPTAEWVQPGLGDGSYCAIARGGNYYMSRQQGRIGRFILDSGGQIIQKGRVDPGTSGYLFIAPFLLDPNNDHVMYLAKGGSVLRNKELTQIPLGSWDSTNINWEILDGTVTKTDSVSALGMSVTPSNRLYYGTIHGKVYRLDNADKTTSIPTEITGASFPKNGYVSCIAVDPNNGNSAIVVFSNYNVVSVFATTDGGATWTAIAGNLEQSPNGSGAGPSCRWVKILPVGGTNVYYIGTSTGLYSTGYLNGANTVWEQEGASVIGNVVVDMIDARASDGMVVAATHGNGIFSASVTAPPAVPAAPLLVSPAKDSVNIFPTQTFSWQPAATAVYYQLQVSQVEDFSSVFAEQNALKATQYDISNLEQGIKTYYWRVRGFNSGGASVYSEVRKFTTAIAAPVLTAPASGATGQSLVIPLVWNTVPGATSYHVQLSPNLGFSTLIIDKTVTETTLQTSGLELTKKYYWHVSAIGAQGEGTYSTRWNFTTGTSSVDESAQSSLTIRAYPNPFANTSTAEYSLEIAAFVTLRLYDERGREVRSLYQGQRAPGTYSSTITGADLPNGRYFLTLTAGAARRTVAMEVRR